MKNTTAKINKTKSCFFEKENGQKNQGKDGNKDDDLLENRLKDTGRGKGKLGQSERVAWTYIHYQT